jgi:hypothetical protein
MRNNVVKGYSIIENSKIVGGTGYFEIHKAIKSSDKSEVSIFLIEIKRVKDIDIFKKEAINLMRFKHPCFLDILEPIIESNKHMVI